MDDLQPSQNQPNSEQVPKNGEQLLQEIDTFFAKSRRLAQEKNELAQEELRLKQRQQQFLREWEAINTETKHLIEDTIQHLEYQTIERNTVNTVRQGVSEGNYNRPPHLSNIFGSHENLFSGTTVV